MLASMNGHAAAVRLLLENGSDINAHIETNRNTALTLACFQGRYEVVQLLVERKANIEHRAKTGLTPLMETASGDYVEVGRILLDHGADVNASPVPSSRDTALTIAADKGNAKFVNLLLEKGAVVEARNKKGCNATMASLKCKKECRLSLEQIEQEEEERANREAMQARKRERKRMRRKAKQEKERQVKGINQTRANSNVNTAQSDTVVEQVKINVLIKIIMNIPNSDHADNYFCLQDIKSNAAAVTKAKREKHRTKKHSQRAAKCVAAENHTIFYLDKVSKSPSSEIQDPVRSSMSPCYTVPLSGDNENWDLFIESQTTHFGQYLCMGKSSNVISNSNSWTVVVPSNSTRSQRSAFSTHGYLHVSNETADWKTTNSNNGFYKRRISIPVSRHDIGKVIVDIESARSDEATERMVYLKGPNEAVQRTYETIQGLLDGSISGNDVLLMYDALKKSTLPSSMGSPSNPLCSFSSKISGTTSVTVQSTIKSGLSNAKVINPNNKVARKTGKPVANSLVANNTRFTSSQATPISVVSKLTKTPAISSSTNSNSSFSSTSTSLTHLTCTSFSEMKTSTSGLRNWSSKVASTSPSKGNFASVAAAGIATQASRVIKPDNQVVQNFLDQSKTTVFNLISAHISPLPSSSHMFPDFIPLPNVGNFSADSLDEVSFPPLNPQSRKFTPLKTATIPSVTSGSLRMDKQMIHASSGDLTYMLSINVFDNPASTVHATSISNSFPSTTLPTTSPSNYVPLTVSPSCGIIHAPQLTISVGSSSAPIEAYVSTLPTNKTQTKSFARAPGSERSAHQRNANVTVTSMSLGQGGFFPTSLLSLDSDGANISLINTNDTTLFTPTKRAITSLIHNPDSHHDSISSHFRPDKSCEWSSSDSSTTPVKPPSFAKNTAFSVNRNSPSATFTHVDSPTVSCHSLMESVSIATNVSHVLDSKGSLHSVPTLWSVPTSDLYPNSLSFQPSFQSLNQIAPNLKTSIQSADSLLQTPLLRNHFQDQYSLKGAQPGILRQTVTQPFLQKSNAVGSSQLQSPYQQTQNSNDTSSLNALIPRNVILTSTDTSLNATLQFKPSAYFESQPTALNGLPSNFVLHHHLRCL
ncbi:Ankyrin repeat domain-containing protein [Schistosoma japonicum]|uniref:Ankyrin repeat domain-containing protein n=1 Tax=Schistosoma japonicum TaxID=6182 RepID=A0A4Z2CLU5_SCHJA|nr:Ankyrin repeat domain-containing protein [Schistosoma japonicum]